MSEDIISFKGKIIRCLYSSDSYKIYAFQVDYNYEKVVQLNEYGNIAIVGDLGELSNNVEYEIEAIEKDSKKGKQYKVIKVRRNTPTTEEQTKLFLQEILTPNQTKTIMASYPNIIDLVMNNRDSEVDLKKLKGIGEYIFKNIKDKIIANFKLIDLVDKFKGNIEFSTIKKLYDKYASIERVMEAFKKNPYECLCGLSRIGFKTADKTLLKMEKEIKEEKANNKKVSFEFFGDLISSKQRMEACIDFYLEENQNNGNTWINENKLYDICEEITPECITHFEDVLENAKKYYIADEEKVFTSSVYNIEKYISDKIIKMLSNSKEMEWEIKCENYKEDKDIILTEEQMGTLDKVCKYNVSLLTAPAGSGKSQSVKMVVNMLEDNNKSYMLMTPTGKSSDVLAEYVGKEAGTIHRQLGYNPMDGWGYNEEHTLNVDVVIVDEFGMVDIFLMKHLLEAIDINRTKVIFVFDSYQLSSVACGNIAHDLLTSRVIPTTYLTKVFRYNEGGLMQVATKIRNSENFLDKNFEGTKVFGDKKDYIYIETDQTKMIAYILKFYKKLLDTGSTIKDIIVLSAYNKGDYGTRNINTYIQEMLQENNKDYIIYGDTYFYKGDKVIQVENNYKLQDADYEDNKYNNPWDFNMDNEEDSEAKKVAVYNGNMGVVEEIRKNGIVVLYKNKRVLYKKEELSQLSLGYCISIHKSQGDSSANVIIISPKAHTFMLNSNLLYVGVTRAKKRVYHIGNIETINHAIKKKENLERNTYLKDLLLKEINTNN